MRFMSESEIDDACERWKEHAVLGPATLTLASLRDAVNIHSDGWPYWKRPTNAAAKLMELIERDGTYQYRHGDREDATLKLLKIALRPLKAFRTRSGLEFEIFEELPVPAAVETASSGTVAIEGHTFEPWQDGLSVGFKVTNRDGRVEYVFLCPSSQHKPGVDPMAAVALMSHAGPTEPDSNPVPNESDDPDLDGPYQGDAGVFSFQLFREG